MRPLALALLTALLATPAIAAPPEIRAYPSAPLHSYPLDSVHGVQGLVVHNIAVVNTTGAPLTIEAVDLELLREQSVVDRRTLDGAVLTAAAKRGAALQAAGMIDAIGFQFGDVLGRPPAKLAAAPVLASGQALLITDQVFGWTGKRDALRVVVRSTGGGETAMRVLPLAATAPEARYAFPMKGVFYVQAAPSLNTHHRWVVPEAFALDIGQLGAGGLSYRGDGARFADYYVYGQPVLAAADGEVVQVISDQVEDATAVRKPGESQQAYFGRIQRWQGALMAKGLDALGGNLVIVRHPWGEYSVYAHLKPGPAAVRVGQAVKAGQLLGHVGSSGSSTEPHLHFHVCDAPSALACVGLPVAFTNVENPLALLPGAIQSGDMVVTK
ncbi:M23 family metallopeptidase [Caulobacter mirabilis]|uniref:M23ase beta-sheet core domain-containing protein n=1 Tax=Caulobacter mirabilis TaxID=69666 RepID=A0A2D2B234_9CAUL|nr:M23 family metallopeptidase [Caulobacter mirabilis]ATQ44278.1 hypothetical protein CSW64_18745 [Caulobacter mirabilis]